MIGRDGVTRTVTGGAPASERIHNLAVGLRARAEYEYSPDCASEDESPEGWTTRRVNGATYTAAAQVTEALSILCELLEEV